MSRTQCLIVLSLGLFLVGCISPPSKNESVLSRKPERLMFFHDCMPYVHVIRDQRNVSQALTFVRNISQTFFSCEYFQGKPIRRFGSFGPKLKIRGQVVYVGWGYAITDRFPGFAELLNVSNFAGHYPSSRNVTVRVERKPITIVGHNRIIQTYFVNVSSKYLGTRTIAALGVLNFSKNDQNYRLFLWIQDYRLTRDKIVKRFGALMDLVVVPSISVTKK